MLNFEGKLQQYVSGVLNVIETNKKYEDKIYHMFKVLNEVFAIDHGILFFLNEDSTRFESVVSYGYISKDFVLYYEDYQEIFNFIYKENKTFEINAGSATKDFFYEEAQRQIFFPLYLNKEPIVLLLLEIKESNDNKEFKQEIFKIILQLTSKILDQHLKIQEQNIEVLNMISHLAKFRENLTHMQYEVNQIENHSLKSLLDIEIQPKNSDEKASPFGSILTKREQEIAIYACKGYSNKTISDLLNISIRTVTTHMHRIYKKLEVKSRDQMIQAVKKL
jgi:DNA-binding CsgD family transcriptional regulator/transcriptional regulator with GAF, ATPase, and Fis domain